MRTTGWAAAACVLAIAGEAPAQRFDYPPAEFVARREALVKAAGQGLVLMFGANMPIAVEPIIEDKTKQLHVRIEDTVLVTEGEPEVLSASVPKEVDDVLALVGESARR